MTPTVVLLRQYEEQILALRRQEHRRDMRRVYAIRIGQALSVAVSVGAFAYLAMSVWLPAVLT